MFQVVEVEVRRTVNCSTDLLAQKITGIARGLTGGDLSASAPTTAESDPEPEPQPSQNTEEGIPPEMATDATPKPSTTNSPPKQANVSVEL